MSRDSVTLRENPCSSKNIRNIRQIRTEQITNTETHGNTRMQMNRDSVKIRENPCSSKTIRKIREIRTEQITNTETHGKARMQMSKLYGSDGLHGYR